MCGICGILRWNAPSGDLMTPLRRMAACMRRRGPDDEGYLLAGFGRRPAECIAGDALATDDHADTIPYYPHRHYDEVAWPDAQLGLAHRRLSIVDLSASGHQPMSAQANRYWIVYNGEIYNYQELAQELTQNGVAFVGSSDTEVLLHAYARWGKDFLHRLNGMFALAIWDDREKRLFCARDRIGIKPFYFHRTEDFFLFASDIKTLIASGLYRPQVDLEGLYHCLGMGVAPRPMTAFAGVSALAHGHWMLINRDGSQKQQRYWRVPVGAQDASMSEEDAEKLLEEHLLRAIRRRLIADVDVGTFMSGGVDSTVVSAMASKLHPGIKAFTLSFGGDCPEMDELEQARATAALCPMDHKVDVIRPERIIQYMGDIVRCYEEPFQSLSPAYVLAKFVKDHDMKVILSGLGGDELFGGYHYYSRYPWWQFFRRISFLMPKRLPLGRYWQYATDMAAVETADRLHTQLFCFTRDEDRRRLFKDPAARDFDTVEKLRELYISEDLAFADPVEALNYMDLRNYIGNHHVYRTDQFTMRFSIEARVPFLDHELVEAAFRIPSRYKVRRGMRKYVLRKMASHWIHPACIEMKKKGFSLPMSRWMHQRLKPVVDEKIELLKQRDLFVPEEVQRVKRLFYRGRISYASLWILVAIEFWLEEFFDSWGERP